MRQSLLVTVSDRYTTRRGHEITNRLALGGLVPRSSSFHLRCGKYTKTLSVLCEGNVSQSTTVESCAVFDCRLSACESTAQLPW